MRRFFQRLFSRLELYRLAATNLAGSKFYLFLLVAPIYLGGRWVLDYLQWNTVRFYEVQGEILALPLACLGIIFGVRIIASEISSHTLEIIYTVPGGVSRVWWAKLFAAICIMIPIELMLAAGFWLFFEPFPLLMLYGGLQAGVFYLCVGMAFATLFKSEVGGGIATFALLLFNGFVTGFGNGPSLPLVNPFFNPWTQWNAEPEQVIAWSVQNRIAMILYMAAIISLAFMRSNRREKLLSV